MHQLLLCTLLLIAVTIQISEAFVVNHPVVGGTLGHKEVTTSSTRFHAASSSSENNDLAKGGGEGGTEWIKNAMGTNTNDDTSSTNTSPPPPSAPYTEDEIKTMENLILELSLEKDDTIRRAKLSAIFDKVFELDVDATTTSSSSTATADGGDAVSSSDGSASSIEEEREAPRFAQLFQYSLDNVGELVQSAAREKAELLNSSNDSNDGDNGSSSSTEAADAKQEESSTSTTEGRVKSEEELQLWALIDMMVQSKTMVKMYMGSLGSKGVFR